MTHLYEGMFILDNDRVRAGWKPAKAMITDLLEKHGATLHTARRWDERRLAYPIRRRRRATYLLAYFELTPGKGELLIRDLDLNEGILRYLMLRAESVPEKEFGLSRAEEADDFTVPLPPEENVALSGGSDEAALEETADEDDEAVSQDDEVETVGVGLEDKDE